PSSRMGWGSADGPAAHRTRSPPTSPSARRPPWRATNTRRVRCRIIPAVARASRRMRPMSNEHDVGIRTGNPFHDLLGVETVERGGGRARARLPMREELKGGVGGGLHGGVLSSLVDIASILAISTIVGPSEQMAGTAELNLSYLRPANGAEVFAT